MLAASDGPVTNNLPSSVAAHTFFKRRVFLDRIFCRLLLASVSSPLVSQFSVDFGMVHVSACPALHSVLPTEKRTLQTKHENSEPEQGGKYQLLLRETAVMLSPPHKRSDTRTPSADQWHESQWQRDWSRTYIQSKKCGKKLGANNEQY